MPPGESVHIASKDEKKRLWIHNASLNLLFIASWFLFATTLSVYNKWMFSDDHLNFPYPLFVTTLHMFVQFILAAILRMFWPTTNPEYVSYSSVMSCPA
ncbi:hypothetical protein BDZ89DRAFT_212652 [Hymenopellis radicata]|nr:hypothetical protein BDZ89DRAFT_212652 [Hymenopellis radicata]